VRPVFRSFLLLTAALTGCDDGQTGPGSDDSADTVESGDTASMAPEIQVTVHMGPEFEGEHQLMIHNPDGSFVTSYSVNQNGTITVDDVPHDGGVTGVFRSNGVLRIYSSLGLRDGDEVTFAQTGEADEAIGTVSWNTGVADPGHTWTNYYTPFSSGGHSAGGTVGPSSFSTRYLADDGSYPFFAAALDADSRLMATGSAVEAEMTGTPPDQSVLLSTEWNTNPGRVEVDFVLEPDVQGAASGRAYRGVSLTALPVPMYGENREPLTRQQVAVDADVSDLALTHVVLRRGTPAQLATNDIPVFARIDPVESVPADGETVERIYRSSDLAATTSVSFDAQTGALMIGDLDVGGCEGTLNGYVVQLNGTGAAEDTTWIIRGPGNRELVAPELDPSFPGWPSETVPSVASWNVYIGGPQLWPVMRTQAATSSSSLALMPYADQTGSFCVVSGSERAE